MNAFEKALSALGTPTRDDTEPPTVPADGRAHFVPTQTSPRHPLYERGTPLREINRSEHEIAQVVRHGRLPRQPCVGVHPAGAPQAPSVHRARSSLPTRRPRGQRQRTSSSGSRGDPHEPSGDDDPEGRFPRAALHQFRTDLEPAERLAAFVALDDERYNALWEDLGREMRRRRPAVPYRAYITGRAWAERREAAKARAGRCQLCGDEDAPLEAHHVTYRRLGAERAGDLTVLCGDCHSAFHDRRQLAEQREGAPA